MEIIYLVESLRDYCRHLFLFRFLDEQKNESKDQI